MPTLRKKLDEWDRLRIRIFVDPEGKCDIEIDMGGPSKAAVEAWVKENCPSAVWEPADGYERAKLLIVDDGEEDAFIGHFSKHCVAYDNFLYNTKNERMGISLEDLKNEVSRDDFLEAYRMQVPDEYRHKITEDRPDVVRFLGELAAAPNETKIYWYNNIGGLAGSSGFCLVNGRHFHGGLLVWRS